MKCDRGGRPQDGAGSGGDGVRRARLLGIAECDDDCVVDRIPCDEFRDGALGHVARGCGRSALTKEHGWQ